MKIRKKVNRHGEFDCFRFRFRQPPSEVAEALRGLFRDWMREREASDTCECYFKHLSVEKSVNPRQVDVLFGWFCDRCLPRLESAVNERLPSVTGLSVGNDLSPYPRPTCGFFTSSRRLPTSRTARRCHSIRSKYVARVSRRGNSRRSRQPRGMSPVASERETARSDSMRLSRGSVPGTAATLRCIP